MTYIFIKGINIQFVYNISPQEKVSILIEKMYSEKKILKNFDLILYHCGKKLNPEDKISKNTLIHDNLITLKLITRTKSLHNLFK